MSAVIRKNCMEIYPCVVCSKVVHDRIDVSCVCIACGGATCSECVGRAFRCGTFMFGTCFVCQPEMKGASSLSKGSTFVNSIVSLGQFYARRTNDYENVANMDITSFGKEKMTLYFEYGVEFIIRNESIINQNLIRNPRGIFVSPSSSDITLCIECLTKWTVCGDCIVKLINFANDSSDIVGYDEENGLLAEYKNRLNAVNTFFLEYTSKVFSILSTKCKEGYSMEDERIALNALFTYYMLLDFNNRRLNYARLVNACNDVNQLQNLSHLRDFLDVYGATKQMFTTYFSKLVGNDQCEANSFLLILGDYLASGTLNPLREVETLLYDRSITLCTWMPSYDVKDIMTTTKERGGKVFDCVICVKKPYAKKKNDDNDDVEKEEEYVCETCKMKTCKKCIRIFLTTGGVNCPGCGEDVLHLSQVFDLDGNMMKSDALFVLNECHVRNDIAKRRIDLVKNIADAFDKKTELACRFNEAYRMEVNKVKSARSFLATTWNTYKKCYDLEMSSTYRKMQEVMNKIKVSDMPIVTSTSLILSGKENVESMRDHYEIVKLTKQKNQSKYRHRMMLVAQNELILALAKLSHKFVKSASKRCTISTTTSSSSLHQLFKRKTSKLFDSSKMRYLKKFYSYLDKNHYDTTELGIKYNLVVD